MKMTSLLCNWQQLVYRGVETEAESPVFFCDMPSDMVSVQLGDKLHIAFLSTHQEFQGSKVPKDEPLIEE